MGIEGVGHNSAHVCRAMSDEEGFVAIHEVAAADARELRRGRQQDRGRRPSLLGVPRRTVSPRSRLPWLVIGPGPGLFVLGRGTLILPGKTFILGRGTLILRPGTFLLPCGRFILGYGTLIGL